LKDKRQIQLEAKQTAQENKIKYFETSAKDKQDLENLLNNMISDVLDEILAKN
jgi:Fe2+ transport system protein B